MRPVTQDSRDFSATVAPKRRRLVRNRNGGPISEFPDRREENDLTFFGVAEANYCKRTVT